MKKILLLSIFFFSFSSAFAMDIHEEYITTNGNLFEFHYDDTAKTVSIKQNGTFATFGGSSVIGVDLTGKNYLLNISTSVDNLDYVHFGYSSTNPDKSIAKFYLLNANANVIFSLTPPSGEGELFYDISNTNNYFITRDDTDYNNFKLSGGFFGFGPIIPVGHTEIDLSVGNVVIFGNNYQSSFSQTCTYENIPNYDFIDIHPTSTGSISEVIQNPTEKTYAYSTSLSSIDPLQIIFFGVEDVIGFSQFMTQTGSMIFKTENKTTFSDDNTFLSINTSSLISSIQLFGDYGNVDIYIYDELGTRIDSTRENINLSSYTSSNGFPIGASASRVDIKFENSLFSKEISNLKVFSISSNTTIDVEICQNDSTLEYTVDGEIYTGNPYTNLVGTPTSANVTFSDDGFIFYDNGFCLSNFVPFPSSGTLLFEIINPDQKRFSTYPLEKLGLYKFGASTCTKITTNYHNIEGKYYVRPVYIYQNVKYYPKGESYFPYDITRPEEITNVFPEDFWEEDKCGGNTSDSGFLPGISTFFSCLTETTGTFVKSVSGAIGSIGSLFNAIGGIGDVDEQKTLNQAFNISEPIFGVSRTYAIDSYVYDREQDPFVIIAQGSFENIPLLNNIYLLIKYTFIGSILLGVMIYLFPNILHKND